MGVVGTKLSDVLTEWSLKNIAISIKSNEKYMLWNLSTDGVKYSDDNWTLPGYENYGL